MRYELKLLSGKVVTWGGTDGPNAGERYVDAHRTESVVAWREPRYGIFQWGRGSRIIP